jgi:hypothetical protein
LLSKTLFSYLITLASARPTNEALPKLIDPMVDLNFGRAPFIVTKAMVREEIGDVRK